MKGARSVNYMGLKIDKRGKSLCFSSFEGWKQLGEACERFFAFKQQLATCIPSISLESNACVCWWCYLFVYSDSSVCRGLNLKRNRRIKMDHESARVLLLSPGLDAADGFEHTGSLLSSKIALGGGCSRERGER